MNKVEAMKYRDAINKATTHLTDEQALESIDIFLPWKSDTPYQIDDRIKSANKLWKCLQGHTSQENWRPEDTPALWVEIAKPGEYREIKDDMLPTEAFALDEIGWYQTKDNLYKSLMSSNIYTPITYPQGWEKL